MVELGARAATKRSGHPFAHYHTLLSNGFLALGLSFLVGSLLHAAGLLSGGWQVTVIVLVCVVGLISITWSYRLTVALLLPAVWLLSPYLVAPLLLLAVLWRAALVRRLPWVLLVVSTPLLAGWHAPALVPLLGGLLRGARGGFWAGIVTALWLKWVATLGGWFPEIGSLHGISITYQMVQENLVGAGPLRLLGLSAASLTSASPLLHLSQVAAWGGAGWIVGRVRQVARPDVRPRFELVPPLASGVLLLWLSMYLLPVFFGLQPLTSFLTARTPTTGLALCAFAAALIAPLVEGLSNHPPRRAGRRVNMHLGEQDTSSYYVGQGLPINDYRFSEEVTLLEPD